MINLIVLAFWAICLSLNPLSTSAGDQFSGVGFASNDSDRSIASLDSLLAVEHSEINQPNGLKSVGIFAALAVFHELTHPSLSSFGFSVPELIKNISFAEYAELHSVCKQGQTVAEQ